MELYSRILITGATGKVGGALYRKMKELGYTQIVAPGVTEDRIDLRTPRDVQELFDRCIFDYVFHCAARVGGIQENIDKPVQHLNDNILMDSNIFSACHRYGVKKVLYLGSSCIYPAKSKQPIKEEYLLDGKLEPTNQGYALSKIVGLQLAKSYKTQYGLNSLCLMPCNIYGTGDTFDLQKAHVLSALVKKFVDAGKIGAPVFVWGTGNARREFIHVDDVVDAILHFFPLDTKEDFINIGPGKDIKIKELAHLISEHTQFFGRIDWDVQKPEGMKQKLLDVTKMKSYGFYPKVSLDEGIYRTIREYRGLQ